MKVYAEKQGASISELVENYFKQIANPKNKKKNILLLVEEAWHAGRT